MVRLEILFGLVAVAVEEETAADIGAEIAPVSLNDALPAEEATTDHAALQLQVRNKLAAFRAPMLFVSISLCHI
jgi:hypothetical protein